jgi:hypothetical protein
MDKRKNIIIIIVLVLSLWINIKTIFLSHTSDNIDKQEYQKSLDSLNEIINIYTNKNILLDEKNILLYKDIDSLNNKIKNNNIQIDQLKIYYDKKINDISNYNTNDITNYFTNRYE